MESSNSHIKTIREAFLQMETREHLLTVLNYAKPFVYGKNAVPFELKQLTYYSRQNAKSYKEFKVKKKSGGDRTIHAPVKGLKAIQKTLAFVLQCIFVPHEAATGFVKNKSIVDNAKAHVGNYYVYNIDLKDFFQSIDQARVWKCLQLKPFLLNDEHPTDFKNKNRNGVKQFTTALGEKIFYKLEDSTILFINDKQGNYKRLKKRALDDINAIKNKKTTSKSFKSLESDFLFANNFIPALVKKYIKTEDNIKNIKFLNNFSRIDLASFISNICCTEMCVERKDIDGNWIETKKNVLPQGAPTSPVLTNVICQRLDYLLSAVAKRFGLKYSRYADDITFSSLYNVFQKDSLFLKELQRVIDDQGFSIKQSKTRLQVDGIRKSVTGLVVNEKVNVKKRYIKQLRMWLYLWERYGYTKAENIFKGDYIKYKGHIKKGQPNLASVVDGKLNYLKMVKGGDDTTYVKLKDRFDALVQGSSQLETILKEWEQNGIKSAMEIYKAQLKMNKFSFVKQLLENEKFNSSQKERFIKLVSEELESSEDFILEEIDSIKQRLDLNDSNIDNLKENKDFALFHNPKKVVEILSKFSENGNPLKYSSHSWVMGQDAGMYQNLEDFLKRLKTEWNKISWELRQLKEPLSTKIWSFLLKTDVAESGWGTHGIKFGWSSPDLPKEIERQGCEDPSSVAIPEYARKSINIYNGIETIQNFEQVIKIFKNEIEIRDDDGSLENLILQMHDQHLTNEFNIRQIDGLNGTNFYTDTTIFRYALKRIFENIKKKPNHSDVSYIVNRDDNHEYCELRIIHHGSNANDKSYGDPKFSLERGDLGEIKFDLFNLCDWSIESQFSEGVFRLNFLSSEENTPRVVELESECVGFVHILKFYQQ